MKAVIRILLLAVLLTSCSGGYPRVTVVNAGGGPLSQVVVTLEEGTSYTIGNLDAGEETTIVVEPRGESDVTLDYTDDSGETRSVSGGYIEEVGDYHLILTVRGDGGVDFENTFD
ncbi:MAG: hypothetical protein A2Y64_05365 [Candidatus Coatesbacteria bacterium RBG_13_66_14]|uniref:Uncharacterized protein n=1 Tax=Candidatus Coatesbacteria bacterium RBG_13_66_14 TaxID=1817816 RepID=A0A1F5F7D2_9BACT|nr:MAG: hypothetical protein A2Y64_05365 [Candidatus Coatesbacteria bacterium RBG_13_66_14]